MRRCRQLEASGTTSIRACNNATFDALGTATATVDYGDTVVPPLFQALGGTSLDKGVLGFDFEGRSGRSEPTSQERR